MALQTISVQYDDTVLFQRFRNYERRLAFGVVNAINNTARRVQQAEFANVASKFTIRKPSFFFGSAERPGGIAARISPFASVPNGRLYADVSVSAGNQASQRRSLLALFEEGGLRQPMTPTAADVAVPLTGRPARPAFSESVQQAFTFQGLAFKGFRHGRQLKKRRRGKGNVPETIFGEFGRIERSQLTLGNVQWKGRNRTFILLHSRLAPDGGVFQRTGKGPGDIQMVYKFVKPFHVDTRLHWMQLARSFAPAWLHEEMQRAAIDVIQHDAGKALAS